MKKRPFVFLCTGMSLDGKLSNYKKECVPISSDDDRDMLYDMRVFADAAMVGGNTLKLDDPGLMIKGEKRIKQRMKLKKPLDLVKVSVISNANDLKIDGDFFTRGSGEKVIFTTKETSNKKVEELRKKAKVFVMGEKKVNLKKALETLYELGVKKLLVEGGGELIFSLLKDNLVDEINLKIGNLIIGGRGTTTFCDGDGFGIPSFKKVKFVKIIKKPNYLILKLKVIK
ncbi:MAG: dihydrofolate reductase family protein [Candidatus Pacebacteria bacterium]|nr:dihydrofolate reductase family protein [Candidatus Paceibacterota bacterium]